MSINRFQKTIAAGLLCGLSLVGCQGNESAQQSPPAAVAVSPSSPANTESTLNKTSAASNQAGFTDMDTVIANTQAAVTAGNFDQAQTEFDKLEASWSQVEDGVKARSKDTYQAIEDTTDRVKRALKTKNKEKALSELQTLTKAIATAAKS